MTIVAEISKPSDKKKNVGIDYLASLKKRYAQATKKQRGQILDEYVATTHYHRKYAMAVLSGKRQRVKRPIRRPVQRAKFTPRPVVYSKSLVLRPGAGLLR